MKKIIFGLLTGLFLLTTSCATNTLHHTANSVPVETQVVSFTVADLEVSPKKAQKSVSWNYKICGPSVEDIKATAEAQLLMEVGADVLVEPEYIVEKRGWLRGGTVTVIGYPAKFKNFHTPTPGDRAMFNKANANHDKKVKGKKHKKKYLVF